MRPIELTLSAFGSYKGTEHIDFTQLGDRGVFLISGKTGAGKSTIFDAISFALFGKPSGDLRKEEMFRSEFADPKTRTYVKLRFAYGGKEYTVERSLPYERKSGRRSRNADGAGCSRRKAVISGFVAHSRFNRSSHVTSNRLRSW